jgi:hypothetical protein
LKVDYNFNERNFLVVSYNPLNLVPDAIFGGVQNTANLIKDGRWPFTTLNNVLNWDNKLSLTQRAHSLKGGVYDEWFQRDIGVPVQFAGAFDFSRNVNNPLDTNYAYSNAALGVFSGYESHPAGLTRAAAIPFSNGSFRTTGG